MSSYRHPPTVHRHRSGERAIRAAALAGALATGLGLAACGSLATPVSGAVRGGSLAPVGPVGYVVCPNAVTPVELATTTPEPDITLPVGGSPTLGDFAIAAAPDGRRAYVVTTDGTPTGTASTHPARPSTTGATSPPPTVPTGVRDVLVPVDLVTQRAGRPITLPGRGATHAVVVLPGGTTVLAAAGSTIVPVDVATGRVGRPVQLGTGRTIFGLAVAPDGATVYALVAGGVFPVRTTDDAVGAEIPTGLSISSLYSPHGIAVDPRAGTVYVVGQGGPTYGGRVLPITPAGAVQPATSFDRFGVTDPAAVAVAPDGSTLTVVDAANDWLDRLPLASFLDPPAPVPLPARGTTVPSGSSHHPTDVVADPDGTAEFVVEGFDSVVPYRPASGTFGPAAPVCSGATSMAVAPAP